MAAAGVWRTNETQSGWKFSLNGASREVRDNANTPLLTSAPLSILSDGHTPTTMGASWQTPEQKAFIGNHTPSYFQHLESDTLKTFWPDFLKKWFELWPLPESEPAPSPVEGSTKAPKSERSKKVAVSVFHAQTSQLTGTHRLSSN